MSSQNRKTPTLNDQATFRFLDSSNAHKIVNTIVQIIFIETELSHEYFNKNICMSESKMASVPSFLISYIFIFQKRHECKCIPS